MNTPRFVGLFSALFVSACLPGALLAAPAEKTPAPRRAAAPLRPQSLAAHEYLPTARLTPGMKGYGLTVFKGTKIERFNVTILGLLRKINNGKDLILVRLEGGPVTKRYANVIAGMSGSPVYVKGRIVGAVAYAPVFAREPLGFLTPIEDMLEAWDPDLPQTPTTASAQAFPPIREQNLPAAILVGGRRVTTVRFATPGETPSTVSNGTLTLVPLATPVSISGVALSRLPALAQLLAPLGLAPSQMPGGARPPAGTKGSPLQPGGAFGVSLATGDLDMTAIGTLTYRRGDKIVGLGHPFTGIGPIDAPMFSAYIHDVLASYQSSQKLGSPVQLVGRVFQDRPFSVGGQIGARPVMVPIAIDIDDRSTRRFRRFRAQILRHPLMTPRIAAFAAANAIAEVHGQPGDSMATVSLEVEAEEVGTIRRTNTFFDALSIGDTATADLTSLLSTLSSNPFYPVGIRSVKMSVRLEPRRDTAQIERIFLKQSRFEPGETVDVGVVLKPYKRDRIVRSIPIRIPSSVPTGSLTLMVQGGGFAPISLGISPSGGLVLQSGSDTTPAASVAQLVRRFSERERNNDLVARLLLPTTAISVGGEKLTSLPPTIADVMRSTRSTGLRVERDEVKIAQATDYVLSGLQTLTIRVARKGAPPASTPAPPPSGKSGNPIPVTPPGGQPVSVSSGEDDDVESETLDLESNAAGAPTISVEEGDYVSPAPTEPRRPAPVTPSEPKKPAGSAGDAARNKDDAGTETAKDTTKPVGRLPGQWQQSTATDFRAGTLEGVTVTSRGDIRLAPTLRKISESNEAYFWTLAPTGDGGVYAGTGDNGLIYKIGQDGTRTEFAKTGELEVHSLVRGADGTLYAGTSPNGRVLRIGADGKASLLFQTEEKYVLALVPAADGGLYAATGGGKGRVYQITADGKGRIVYEGGESHVTALALGPDGALYAGTAPNALVVRVAGKETARPIVLYDAAESTISGLGVDSKGTVYAGTNGRGVLYRISPDATTRVVYDKASGPLSGLQVGADGTVWVASGATIHAVAPDDTVQTYDAPSDIQILSLLLAPAGEGRPDRRIWASTGNVGAVYALGGSPSGASRGTLVSSVFDAKGVAQWGTLRWTATLPAETRVLLETRTGNVAEPDTTWSSWSRPYSFAGGEKIVSPPGRYLQYRATLEGSGDTSPALRTVEAFYLTRNLPPTVTISSPRGGEVWRGSKIVRWSGSDPDKDTLSYVVELSVDGGKVWTPVRGTRTTTSTTAVVAPPTATTSAVEKAVLARVRQELDKQPEISAEMRERILRDAVPAARESLSASRTPAQTTTPKPPASATIRETSLPLDTAKWPDGTYQLRVVASDAAANPQEPLIGERVSSEFRIVNSAPALLLSSRATTVMSDRSAHLSGTALHRLIAIRAVQYRVDGGDWMAAAATDGLFDSSLEPFRITTPPLTPGAHTVEVQAQDEAGNLATQKTTVQVR